MLHLGEWDAQSKRQVAMCKGPRRRGGAVHGQRHQMAIIEHSSCLLISPLSSTLTFAVTDSHHNKFSLRRTKICNGGVTGPRKFVPGCDAGQNFSSPACGGQRSAVLVGLRNARYGCRARAARRLVLPLWRCACAGHCPAARRAAIFARARAATQASAQQPGSATLAAATE